MNQAKNVLVFFIFLAFQVNSQAQTKHSLQIFGGVGAARGQSVTRVAAFGNSYNTIGGRFGVLYVNQNEHITFKTGLNLTVMGEKYDLFNAQWGTQHNGNGGFNPLLPSGEVESIYYTQNYNLLEIPFLFHFNFRQNTKWIPYGEIGLAVNIFSKTNNSSSTQPSLALPSAIANLGLQYEYKPNQFLFVQPSFTVMTTQFNRKIQIHSTMYLLNLEVGARYVL
jgi:hypothetical protein